MANCEESSGYVDTHHLSELLRILSIMGDGYESSVGKRD
jgi:hypothetical protein